MLVMYSITIHSTGVIGILVQCIFSQNQNKCASSASVKKKVMTAEHYVALDFTRCFEATCAVMFSRNLLDQGGSLRLRVKTCMLVPGKCTHSLMTVALHARREKICCFKGFLRPQRNWKLHQSGMFASYFECIYH